MGAIEELDMLKENSETRYRHSVSVCRKALEVLGQTNILGQQSQQTLRSASLLHDIGYREDIAITGFHPYDGYVHLKSLGYSRDVCLLVLHHSLAEYDARVYDLSKVYKENQIDDKQLRDLLYILSYADWHTSHTGEAVTFFERMKSIIERHGRDSEVVKGMFLRLDEIQGIIHYVENKLCTS